LRSCREEEMSGEAKFIPRERNAGHPGNYVFDRNTPPVLEVEPGESFTAETEDTYNGILRQDPGRLQPRDMKPYCDKTPVWYNPVCGPVYIRGVEPGDVLVVNIEKITEMSAGTTATIPGAHHFAGLRGWEECDEMYTGVIENVGGKGTWRYGPHSYTWDLKPFLGTMATAPEFESLSTLPTSFGSAAACGGNLDCQDVREGARVYLQSFNEGGLLFFGDMHASQGDGELCGVANEVAGVVTLSCQVIKKKRLRNVRIETPESLISVYCYRPAEEAFKQALSGLIHWLEKDYGVTRREAYILVSICPDFRLHMYQMCAGLGRLMVTVGAEFPKKMLP